MQVMPMLHDHDLIARYTDGDEQAFETLLARYKAKNLHLYLSLCERPRTRGRHLSGSFHQNH